MDESDTERHPMMKDEVQEERHYKDASDDPDTNPERSSDVSSLPIDKGWAWMVLLGMYIWTLYTKRYVFKETLNELYTDAYTRWMQREREREREREKERERER